MFLSEYFFKKYLWDVIMCVPNPAEIPNIEDALFREMDPHRREKAEHFFKVFLVNNNDGLNSFEILVQI